MNCLKLHEIELSKEQTKKTRPPSRKVGTSPTVRRVTSPTWGPPPPCKQALNTRKMEHLRNTKTAAKGSRIANHAWSNNRAIDFENASIIDKGTFRTRKTLEAWHTKVTPNADNNSCPLPRRNTTFFLTNIHNYLHFYYFATRAFYSNFLIAFLSFILPVEDCSSGSRKFVVFNHFSQRSFLDFNYVSSWLRPFNILK